MLSGSDVYLEPNRNLSPIDARFEGTAQILDAKSVALPDQFGVATRDDRCHVSFLAQVDVGLVSQLRVQSSDQDRILIRYGNVATVECDVKKVLGVGRWGLPDRWCAIKEHAARAQRDFVSDLELVLFLDVQPRAIDPGAVLTHIGNLQAFGFTADYRMIPGYLLMVNQNSFLGINTLAAAPDKYLVNNLQTMRS